MLDLRQSGALHIEVSYSNPDGMEGSNASPN